MAENKTKPTQVSVVDFLNKIEDSQKRKDSFELLEIMKKLTGEEAVLWGPSLIGFGTYHYKYESGREGDFFLTGFSPRKQNLTIYIMSGFSKYEVLMNKLGKHKTGKSCLYIKKLTDIDISVLEELIILSVAYTKKLYPN
ncbi:DUF1801 domain-containing protein [Ascidiimonas sp. W6]|uniref:DUF1801 domain-containing protein n=1 Tax=Ascidiimonas meishanensis TaxID=3128903 RepID=UPI0030EF2FA0